MAIMKQRRSKENFIKKTSQFVKDINDVCSVSISSITDTTYYLIKIYL